MTDTTHEAPDLLPCPFCGGKPYLANVEMAGCAYVVCTDCRMQSDDGSQQRVVTAWNTRNADLVQQDDDEDFHPASAGDDPIWLGGVEYITKSRSDDLVQAAVAAKLRLTQRLPLSAKMEKQTMVNKLIDLLILALILPIIWGFAWVLVSYLMGEC
jgi:Lar family restriction alleviation protein